MWVCKAVVLLVFHRKSRGLLDGDPAETSGGNLQLALTMWPMCATADARIVIFMREYRHPVHRMATDNAAPLPTDDLEMDLGHGETIFHRWFAC
ncbi:hypothetical protein [Oleiagrimonas sp.]|jgi:hypothetical protein|uniref:hypothetical protein n=1 Tax=Oleiagrimonas sp. TaxID=2010330 RepID=UPI00261C7AB6|nr:hypothetical protein [Oleiagrimonas sp.]MDA3912888.1 hypothetical protein [Oleiagrimonas sp.]